MRTFKEKQFTAAYNRIMLVTFGAVLLISVGLIAIQVRGQSERDDARLVDEFKTRSVAIDNLIAGVTDHLGVLQSAAESHFLNGEARASRLSAALAQSEPQRFSLDTIPSPYEERDVGNLTGAGQLAQLPSATRDELEMALGLNGLLSGTRRNLPFAAWVYYTSARRFINVHPWTHSSRVRFSDALYEQPFYRVALPANNPDRKAMWTPVYVDEFGKGMMVTATQPVYRGAEFIGTVSIDITLDVLTRHVRDFAEAGGELMIVNAAGELIAHPNATSPSDTRIRLFRDFVPGPLSSAIDQLFTAAPLELARRNGQVVVWSALKHAPWKVVFIAAKRGLATRLFSSAGVLFVVLLGALSVMLVSMRMLTFREFVHPAECLVRHIFLESENEPGAAPAGLPPPWRPWFAEVSTTFAQNRQLIREINQKNQQLTDMNISLERYTPRFVLLLSVDGGSGGTVLGNGFAAELARNGASTSTLYLEFPDPGKLARELGVDPAVQSYRHPDGYDIWTSYGLGQIPAAGVSAMLMAKVLHKYDNVVIGVTVRGAAEAFVDSQLEPMLRYAKAIVVVVPPQRAADASLKHLVKHIKRGLRQDHANVYVVANHTQRGLPAAEGADFEIGFAPCHGAVTSDRAACPGAADAVIRQLVDRVDRVHQIAAYIPTTIAVDQPLDTDDVVQRALAYFGERFGGATSSRAHGAWRSEASGVVSEVVHLVVSYTTEAALSQHLDDVIDFIKTIKIELRQEAMALEINRKLVLI